MAKKRYNNGGVVANSNYPFGQGQTSAAPAAPATPTGLGNMSPLVQVSTPGAQVEETTESSKPFGMKKGGSVRGWGMARGARKAKIR